jgi:S1-C subfamily serine protease
MTKQPITKIIKKILPAVVSITASKKIQNIENPFSPATMGGGSGFIVDSSGIILTNRHVVANPDAEYTAVLNEEKKYKARILAKDPINDVAILKVEGENFPFIKLGNSSKLELGQTVIAIGNTLGIFRNTVSTGVISGLSRHITAFNGVDNRSQRLRGLIQTDAAINPGNSGGPLIDANGKAIGINAAMILGAENIGFTLPINTAKNDLDDLKKYGRIRQPFLGVRYILLDKALQTRYNLSKERGALVISEDYQEGTAVLPGSPAYKAGIKEADIILAIQNENISCKNSLEDVLQKFKIGQIINLKILRDNKEMFCQTKIEEKF